MPYSLKLRFVFPRETWGSRLLMRPRLPPIWPWIESIILLLSPCTCIQILGGLVRVVVLTVPPSRPESMTIRLARLTGTLCRLGRLKQITIFPWSVLLHPPSSRVLNRGPRAPTTAAPVVTAPASAERQVPVFLQLFRRSSRVSVLARPANLRASCCRAPQDLRRVLVSPPRCIVLITSARRSSTRLPITRMTFRRTSIVTARLKASTTPTTSGILSLLDITSMTPSIIMTLGKKDTINTRSGANVRLCC